MDKTFEIYRPLPIAARFGQNKFAAGININARKGTFQQVSKG